MIPRKKNNALSENYSKDDFLIQTLESLPISIIIFSSSKILFANKVALKIFKAPKGFEKNISEHSIFDFLLPEHHQRIRENNKRILNGEEFEPYVVKIKNAKKEVIDLEIKSNLVLFNGKKAIQTAFIDVTKERKYKFELEQKWISYQNLIDNTPIGIFIHKGECIYCNKSAANILEEPDPKKLIGKDLIKFIIPQQQQSALDRMTKALKGEELSDLTYLIRTKKRKVFEVELRTSPFIFNGIPCVQTIISKSSTEKLLAKESIRAEAAEEANKRLLSEVNYRKKIQLELREQTSKLKAVFDSTEHVIWTVDTKYRLTSFNSKFEQLFIVNNKTRPLLNKAQHLGIPKSLQKEYVNFWYPKYKKVFKGEPQKFERKSNTNKGVVYYMGVSLNPIYDTNGKVIEIACLAHDLTEIKLGEELAKDGLLEKELLLKELHHRVKNNMQVISSLLNLQSSYVNDAYTLGLLKESQNRIKAMAFIHESLYQTKNLQKIDFSEYIGTLSKNLIYSYGLNAQKVKLDLQLESVFLNINDSIPCGLIINEIISNSLKYAFPKDRDGIIFVTLKKSKNKVTLIIGDNGVGITKTLDIDKTETLGLQLVNTLAEQLNAKITLKTKIGLTYIIEFNI